MAAVEWDNPSDYLNKLAKHPRVDGSGPVDRDRQKRPLALEDGNWICEESGCGNVNYPRRTECHKCGKKRGPRGDAIVRDYVEKVKRMREGGGGAARHEEVYFANPGYSGGGMGGAVSLLGHSQVYPQVVQVLPGEQQHLPFLPAGTDGQFQLYGTSGAPSVASMYTPGDFGQAGGRRSTLSAAAEGKRLAEQLVASFASSSDPIADAGECLASATLWLQTMKARGPTSSTAPFPGAPLPDFSGSNPLGFSSTLPAPPAPIFSSNGGSIMGAAGPGAGPYFAAPFPSSLGPAAGPGIPPGNPQRPTYPGVKFEDWKDKPSDFLREFGDPAASGSMGKGHYRPAPGVDGNWECEKCSNVNFPRRERCHKCNEKRGEKAEGIVREYVRELIEGK